MAGGEDRFKTQVSLVTRHQRQAVHVEKDILHWRLVLQNTLTRVHELEKLREKYGNELLVANQKYSLETVILFGSESGL